MNTDNYMELIFPATSQNEAFARVCAAAFAARLDCTMEDISDIKTAVSEAVTNVVVHAYGLKTGKVILRGKISGDTVTFEIQDFGKGIEDIQQAMQPFYSTGNCEERSGMGFNVMQSFMDRVVVHSQPGRGTTVRLEKIIPISSAEAAAHAALS